MNAELSDPNIEIIIPDMIKITIKKLKRGAKYIRQKDFFTFGSSL